MLLCQCDEGPTGNDLCQLVSLFDYYEIEHDYHQ